MDSYEEQQHLENKINRAYRNWNEIGRKHPYIKEDINEHKKDHTWHGAVVNPEHYHRLVHAKWGYAIGEFYEYRDWFNAYLQGGKHSPLGDFYTARHCYKCYRSEIPWFTHDVENLKLIAVCFHDYKRLESARALIENFRKLRKHNKRRLAKKKVVPLDEFKHD